MLDCRDLTNKDDGFQDFVITHELLHLRVPNHGRLFKALMSSHIPNWRTYDDSLKCLARSTNRLTDHGTQVACSDRIGDLKQIFGASSQLAALAGSFRLAYVSAVLPNEDADLAMRVV